MTRGARLPAEIDRLRSPALLIGAVAFLVGLGGNVVLGGGFDRALYSWLTVFFFWTGISLGCMALAMVHVLSGGGWGVVIRRPLQAAAGVVPWVMLVGFVPLAIFAGRIWHWADSDAVAHDVILQWKSPYLNVPFFIVRNVIYLIVWTFLARQLVVNSDRTDATGDSRYYERQRMIAGPGIAAYILTVTFWSVDWVMSLAPHWFSTIFGVLTVGGQGLGALAFIIIVLVMLSRHEPVSRIATPDHFHDVGKLMLAFVMLWAYFAFSQFLIIWAGNLPEELPWYLNRLRTDWKYVSLTLALLHFALPFAMLLSADLKRRSRRLVVVACLVLAMRIVDSVWLIAPEFHHGHGELGLSTLFDFIAVAGFGGIWFSLFLRNLAARPILPVHSPNVAPRDEVAESHA